MPIISETELCPHAKPVKKRCKSSHVDYNRGYAKPGPMEPFMPIMVTCSHCQSKAMVREEFAGRSVKCPKCGEIFQATANPALPPMPAEAPRVFSAPPAATPAPPLSMPVPPPTLPAQLPLPVPPSAVTAAPVPIVVTCTYCQTKAKIAAEFAGRHVKCPSCQQVYVAAGVPLPAEPPLARIVDNTPELRDRYSPESRRDDWDRRPPRSDDRREDGYPPRRSRYDDDAPRGRYDDDDDFRAPRSFERMPRKLPGAEWAVVVVCLMVAVMLGSLVFVWQEVTILDKMTNQNELQRMLTWSVLLAVFRFVLLVVLIVFFCVWIHRFFTNLRQLFRVKGLTFSPGWAVGCWFIPFLFFVWPLMAVQELWKASDPKASPRSWRDSSLSILAIFWFIVWWANILLRIISMVMAQEAVNRFSLDKLKTAVFVEIASVGLMLAAAFMLIFLVLNLRSRQEKKFQYLLREMAGLEENPEPRDERDYRERDD